MRLACTILAGLLLAACSTTPKPQHGGASATQLGGVQPTTITLQPPENPETPSTTTVEKTIERDYIDAQPTLPEAQPPRLTAGSQNSVDSSRAVATSAAPAASGIHPRGLPQLTFAAPAPRLVRERIHEKATTQVGTSWRDTARELGVKLENMRGVMWVGVLLLIGGPIVGIRMGWPLNGAIAGGTGLLLIILAQVVPGNEAWFGLIGLLLIPAVSFIYYRSRHDAATEAAK